jgi:protein-disulfide isomerase
VQELDSPCANVAVSLATCVLEKRDCAKCVPAARFVVKAVRSGRSKDQVEDAYKKRYDPSTLKTIAIDGSPMSGPSDAPVTIVEFADFQCPACQAMEPVVEKVVNDHKDKVRLVYKFIALTMHPRAEPAARAAIAAWNQNRFWEYHHKLFETQALEQPDLERDARALNLDMGKWSADLNAQSTNDRLDRDKKLFDDINGDHTPTIFVNGREIDPTGFEDWVVEELGGDTGSSSAAIDAGAARDGGGSADAAPVDASTDAKGK